MQYTINYSNYFYLFLGCCSLETEPILSIKADPGITLFESEDLVLTCVVHRSPSGSQNRVNPGANAVWYRSLLDPAGRRLRSLTDKRDSGERSGRKRNKKRKRIYVTERTAELISHGELLLSSDPRFSLHVHRTEKSIEHILKVNLSKKVWIRIGKDSFDFR